MPDERQKGGMEQARAENCKKIRKRVGRKPI